MPLQLGLHPHTTTDVVYVKIVHEWRDLEFQAVIEQGFFFFRNFSWQFYFTLRIFAGKRSEVSGRRNIFSVFRYVGDQG